MKKSLFLFLILCCTHSLVQAQQYLISAELTGFPERTRFYLKDLDADVVIDSAEIIGGKFAMKGKSTQVKGLWLYARPNNQFHYTNLLIGPEQVQVKGDIKDFPWDVQLTGSKNQDIANKLKNQTKTFWKNRDSLVNLLMPYLMKAPTDSTKAIMRPLEKQINKIDSAVDEITIKFIKENINSYTGLQEFYWKRNYFKKPEFEALFNTVNPELRSSNFGQRITNYLKVGDALKKGDTFYDFEASDIKGKKYRLSNYKGKYILLDFTETYCGPCILSAEDLKILETKYADKLQIISFYAETNKKTMQEGLTRDKPAWPSIWDGKGNYSEITLKYGVRGYPTFVVIGPDGKILSRFSGYGKDDNGKGSLENQIDKLLQPKP